MPKQLPQRQLFQTRLFAKFAILGLLAFGVMGLTFAASTPEGLFTTKVAKHAPGGTRKNEPADQRQSQAVPRVKTGYVIRAGLQPRLREALSVMGNRLEVAGKERLMLDGTLRVGGHGSPIPVRVIRELADKLHLEGKGEGQRLSLNFNGQRTGKVGDVSGLADESLLETLVNDSAEHYFAGQFQGFPTRLLGFRFRLDDGTDENYAGPFYDVYQVEDHVRVSGELRRQVKLYHFNSDTRLLERVRYQTARDGMPIEVEVVLGDWHSVQGEMFPRQITRIEGGGTAFSLRLESISVAPRAEDGLFPLTDKK